MAGAVFGIYGNAKQEAMYPAYLVDADGQPLDGSQHEYTLRFASGQLPPVNAFWSLTMYVLPQSLLYANPLDRYLINSPMLPNLVKDPDGGITLVTQHEAPGAAGDLYDARALSRAIEVYLEQMPAFSVFAVRRGLRAFGAVTAQHVVIWESLMDAATLLLTGNTETVYGLTLLDLRGVGPTVVEVPAGMLGAFSDMWQGNVADVGKTGLDGGQGGKLLILPPDQSGEAPDGFLSATWPTFGVWFGLRGMLVDGKTDQAVALFKQIRSYRLAQADNPPPMTFLNGSRQAIDTIFPDTARFFADLAQLVQEEPADILTSLERFSLAAIGIEKGKDFAPDPALQTTLADAARVGSATARANTFASRDPERLVYPDRRWEWLFIGGSAALDTQGYVNVDRRAAFAYAAIGMSPAMANRVVGAGSRYIWTPRDGTGAILEGGQRYRLHLPPRIPVGAFWSVVVYDAESRSLLQNGQPFPSVSQYTDQAINEDGSVDVWFGPDAPQGHERNWIKTLPGKGWFTLVRFYSPLQPFFDQSWKPGDIERQS